MEQRMKAKEMGGAVEKSVPCADENVSGYYIPPRAKNVQQLLQYTTVEHLLASHGHIHSAIETDTVETALQSFIDNSIQSIPVYSSKNQSKYLGLVDTTDILDFFFSLSREQLYTDFFQTSLGQLVEMSKIESTPMVSIGTPLIDVLQILSTGETHRIGVRDPNSEALFNIISQMSLVQFISRNISLIEDSIKEAPVSKFMKQIITVETIPSDTPTLNAFNYLFRRNISAAAVVDAAGIIIDTLSISDISGFLYDNNFSNLNSYVTEFLMATRRTKSTKPPIVCHMDSNFEYVLMKLGSTRVHRLWVVDEQNRYLGLVNLTNVLGFSISAWVGTEAM